MGCGNAIDTSTSIDYLGYFCSECAAQMPLEYHVNYTSYDKFNTDPYKLPRCRCDDCDEDQQAFEAQMVSMDMDSLSYSNEWEADDSWNIGGPNAHGFGNGRWVKFDRFDFREDRGFIPHGFSKPESFEYANNLKRK